MGPESKRKVHTMTEVRTDENPDGTGDKTLRELGLTLMHPCFGQEKRISKLLEVWDAWSDDVKQHVNIVLVDDHGTPSVQSMLSGRTMDYNLSVYRILDDIKHNIPGAINLGMMVAYTPWILTMDTDYTFKPDVMQNLLDFKPHQQAIYAFFQQREPHDEAVNRLERTHTNTWLIHKETFTDLNGFDEDFSVTVGAEVQQYGYHDLTFLHKFQREGYQYIQQRGYIATEWKDDLSSVGNIPANTRISRIMWRAKTNDVMPTSTDMLRFKWKKETSNGT